MKTEQNNTFEDERDILFSRTIKAGKRVYYIDVKKNRTGEMYLCITESKRQKAGDDEFPTINYEKHKIFLFPEDFQKFTNSLQEATQYIEQQQGEPTPRKEFPREIQIDIDF